MTDMIFGTSMKGGAVVTQGRINPRVYQNREHRYNNDADLYTKLGMALKASERNDFKLTSALSSLRNPIHRVVEFHAATILTGTAKQAFPLGGVDEALVRAIHLLWQWSNLDQRKQVLKRYAGIYGQVFLKVVSPKDTARVHLQVLKPQPVTDFEKDDRGNLVYVRLDTAFEKEEGQPPRKVKKVRTEIWRKGTNEKPGHYRVWERDEDRSEDTVLAEKSLAATNRTTNLELSASRSKDSLGFDFVPFVEVAAMDIGEKRPRPIYDHALPLIDEQNRMATRLHDLLFRYNKPFKAIQGIGNDASGRPLAPPKIENQNQGVTVPFGGSLAHLLEQGSKDDLTLGGDILFGLPGNAQLADVTPQLNFDAARNAILDMATELREELPELIYYATTDKAQLSGRALRLLLAGAVHRAEEMRANIQAALIKANKMALTIGQVRGLPGFGQAQIGAYQNGEGFRHEFEETEILPISDAEREEVRTKKIVNAQALVALGIPRERALKEVGLDLEVEPEPEGEIVDDDLARAAEILAGRNGDGQITTS